MPRTWRIVVACLLTTSFVAAGAALGSAASLKHARRAHQSIALSGSSWRSVKTRQSGAKRRPEKSGQPSAAAQSAAASTAPVLLGAQAKESKVASIAAGSTRAFTFTGAVTGNATSITVFVDGQNRASKLIAGLYTDRSGHPGSLLASGAAAPTSGAWNTVAIGAAVSTGTKYWLAVLGTGGRLYVRQGTGGPCQSETSTQLHLTKLPSSWTRGAQTTDCPISAYVRGSAAPSPVTTTAPTLTGSTGGTGGATTTPTPALSLEPKSAFTISPNPVIAGQAATFDSTASTCVAPCSYQWTNSDDGQVYSTASSFATTFSSAGDYPVTLTVTDVLGLTDSSTQTLQVVAPPSPPANTAKPTISGTAQEGSQLTAGQGTWSGTSPLTYAYQWQRCSSSCSNISGATAGTYSPVAADVGDTLDVKVTASNTAGSASATSKKTATIAGSPVAPSNMAKPTVSGTAQQGSQLTASTGTWSGTTPMTYAYQWQNCSSSCSNISGATSSSYTPTASDMGDTLDVKVMASNGAGNASATSNQTASVTAPSGGGGSGSCDLNATPSNFTAQVAAATSGQTICLGAGNYAEWDGGTTKTLTITAAPGASPNFCFDLYNTSNLTIDGGHTNYDITTAGINSDCGDGIESSSSNITIKNVSLSCDGANNFCIDDRSENSGINITKNIFHDMQYPNNASAGVFVNKSNNDPTSTHIDYNLFENMGADGIDPGNGVTMIGNDFNNVNSDSTDPRHTDVIQFAEDDVIEGNFVHDGCIQGIDAFDGAANNTITDNVIVSCSVHSLVTAADTPGSLVAHNTVIGAGGLECGSKTGSPPSTTQVRDNILQEGINWGGVKCTPSVDQDNMSWPSFGQISSSSDFIGTPQFTGGSNPSTYAGYALAAGSPGKSKASDGGDVGARVNLYPRPAGLA